MADGSLFASPQVGLAIGLVFVVGILTGLLLANSIIGDIAEITDADGDGIADRFDIEPSGDAGLTFSLIEIIHGQSTADRSLTLILGYNDGNDQSGTLAGQVCWLNFTVAANTSVTRPTHSCAFQVDDYGRRSVSFEYRLFETLAGGVDDGVEVAWDLFPGADADNPWGTNATVDPMVLANGVRIELDGMSDGDAWENNARIVWMASSNIFVECEDCD